MIDTSEFLTHVRVEAEILETWVEAGWLLPSRDADVRRLLLLPRKRPARNREADADVLLQLGAHQD